MSYDSAMTQADDLIKQLNLVPHPEGGFYRETYRCRLTLPQDALPAAYSGNRSASTSIYYLLTPGTFSCMHRIVTDEVFHFYAGDPVEMLQLSEPPSSAPDGTIMLGNQIDKGQVPQHVVPAHVWQGCRIAPAAPGTESGGEVQSGFALLGCTVAPGFDFADYTEGTRDLLTAQFPQFAELIAALTKR